MSDGWPLISIVIPVYKPDVFFAQALQSIQQQTFKNFEVIVSDDSTDDGAQQYIKQYPQLNICYYKNPNERGIFNNLNHAITKASGSYIQIFCQDDLMKENFLAKQIETFEKYPSVGMVFSKYNDIDEECEVLPRTSDIIYLMDEWPAFLPMKKAFNCFFAFGCFPGNLSPVMLKRNAIAEAGTFDSKYSFGGDLEYWLRVVEKFDIAYNKADFLQVRTHSKRASNTIGFWKLVPEGAELYRYLYRNNSVRCKKVWQYLQVNNLLAGYFKGVFKEILKGKLQYFKLIRHFSSPPFSVPVILVLIIHRFFKGKESWFIKEKDC